MAKLPFSSVARMLVPQFATGGEAGKDGPGQTTPAPGTMVPVSQIQKAMVSDSVHVTKQQRKTAVILSPFAAEDLTRAAKMERYALRCVKDSLSKNEAPLASQTFYTELNIRNPIERDVGLQSQMAWVKQCDKVVVYVDFGMTPAMETVLNLAMVKNKRIEYRTIGAVA